SIKPPPPRPAPGPILEDRGLPEAEQAMRAATHRYKAGWYSGRLTLFLARKRPPQETGIRQMGWAHVAGGGLEVRVVEGDHFSMMNEPDVGSLTGELEACLKARELRRGP